MTTNARCWPHSAFGLGFYNAQYGGQSSFNDMLEIIPPSHPARSLSRATPEYSKIECSHCQDSEEEIAVKPPTWLNRPDLPRHTHNRPRRKPLPESYRHVAPRSHEGQHALGSRLCTSSCNDTITARPLHSNAGPQLPGATPPTPRRLRAPPRLLQPSRSPISSTDPHRYENPPLLLSRPLHPRLRRRRLLKVRPILLSVTGHEMVRSRPLAT